MPTSCSSRARVPDAPDTVLINTRSSAACFIVPRAGPGEAWSRRPARRSLIGCPRWSCGSHLACAGRASLQGQERLKKGL
jgi:hypothetical protein